MGSADCFSHRGLSTRQMRNESLTKRRRGFMLSGSMRDSFETCDQPGKVEATTNCLVPAKRFPFIACRQDQWVI